MPAKIEASRKWRNLCLTSAALHRISATGFKVHEENFDTWKRFIIYFLITLKKNNVKASKNQPWCIWIIMLWFKKMHFTVKAVPHLPLPAVIAEQVTDSRTSLRDFPNKMKRWYRPEVSQLFTLCRSICQRSCCAFAHYVNQNVECVQHFLQKVRLHFFSFHKLQFPLQFWQNKSKISKVSTKYNCDFQLFFEIKCICYFCKILSGDIYIN